MALANGRSPATTSSVSCPIQVFLDFQKWKFVNWDKDEQMNIEHDLNRVSLLDIWYTVKGKIWNDSTKTFTGSFYSNEIKSWDERLHVYHANYIWDWQVDKIKIAEWIWKSEVKNNLPDKANIYLALTLLDHSDNIVKEIFLSGNNFYKVSQSIKETKSTDIISFTSETKFLGSEWKKEIWKTQEEVDQMKWSEAMKFKPRYIVSVEKVWVIEDQDIIDAINTFWNELDDWFDEKRKMYNTWDTQEETSSEKEKPNQNKYAQLTSEQQKQNIDS